MAAVGLLILVQAMYRKPFVRIMVASARGRAASMSAGRA